MKQNTYREKSIVVQYNMVLIINLARRGAITNRGRLTKDEQAGGPCICQSRQAIWLLISCAQNGSDLSCLQDKKAKRRIEMGKMAALFFPAIFSCDAAALQLR